MTDKESYEKGWFEAITQFSIEILKAYYEDEIDEPEINRIERMLKNKKI